ncbi:MAG: hypothetical protein H8D65_01880 [Spirochaetes bacterium]|nr:hypothetical protein [Spirochaetota bacterium]
MTKILLLSGFLGSGKTTLMLKLAGELQRRGNSVSLITNDQGNNLVDTGYAAAAGFDTREITGGCFCCKFPDLLSTLSSIAEVQQPDYVIAEAVGSCTDLNATVIQPLLLYHSDLMQIAGFWALADGFRFSFAGEYTNLALEQPVLPLEVLVSHQISESAVVLLTKCDLLTAEEQQAGLDRIRRLNPNAEIAACSAKTGEGLKELAERLRRGGGSGSGRGMGIPPHPIPLNYDVYAEAEAEYGWYNGSWNLKAAEGETINPANAAAALLDVLQEELNTVRNNGVFPIAHAKIQVITAEGSIKTGIAGGHFQAPDVMELPGNVVLQMVVNIRAAFEPEILSLTVREKVLMKLLESFPDAAVSEYSEQILTPSRPEPTYRIY